MQPQNMTFEYQILKSQDLDTLAADTQKLLNEGWQMSAPIQIAPDGTFIQGMILPKMENPEPSMEQPRVDFEMVKDKAIEAQERFYKTLGKYTADLLEVNSIYIRASVDGLVVRYDGKDYPEVTPDLVLTILQSAKFVPQDLDETRVIQEVTDALK